MRAVLLEVNEELLLSKDQSGSTALAALRVGRQFTVGHVGDSRAVLCQYNATWGMWPSSSPCLCAPHTSACAVHARSACCACG